jgi:hypothetical protein
MGTTTLRRESWLSYRPPVGRRRERHRAARRFAGGFAAFFLPVFALPLLLKPYAWARAFGRKPEPETDVGVYFGRCLGAVATGVCVQAIQAAGDPAAHRSFFRLVEVGGWLLALVHLRGMLESRQPPIEHVEIAGYALTAIAARRVRP